MRAKSAPAVPARKKDAHRGAAARIEENLMPKVEINTPAPDFSLADYRGRMVRLSDFRGQAAVVLVFNRGFT
jgi:hypothetical protein